MNKSYRIEDKLTETDLPHESMENTGLPVNCENITTKENIEKSKKGVTFEIAFYFKNKIKYYYTNKRPVISNGVVTFNDTNNKNRETIISGTFEIIKRINDNKE